MCSVLTTESGAALKREGILTPARVWMSLLLCEMSQSRNTDTMGFYSYDKSKMEPWKESIHEWLPGAEGWENAVSVQRK